MKPTGDSTARGAVPAARRGLLVWLVGVWPTLLVAAEEPAPKLPEPAKAQVDFESQIKPILAARCWKCHAAEKQESGLRLDWRGGMLQGGDNGPAMAPGKSDQSALVLRAADADPDGNDRMPPEGKPLSADEIGLVRAWIDQGASWPGGERPPARKLDHWSFKPIERPPLPSVQRSLWPLRGLDRFVLARLEKEGLTPAAEADRHTLVRRVSLDLLGLPPSPQQVDEFLTDKRPDAYERLVDRLLADPAYGERWARMWLDLARYADSKGYGSDPLRTIWGYRDWVIDAFNRNLPYDQFTIEQLAGDLLPGATSDQVLATAFHRNTMANDEGGTDDEEFRIAAVKDRVDTTAQVWMGLTMGCAKCHSHKFDPITHREYYQFSAFFNQTEDADRSDEQPRLTAPTPLQRATIEHAHQRLAALKQAQGSAADAASVQAEIARLEESIKNLEKQAASTPVLRELPADKQRPTHVLAKANFLEKGEQVSAAVPGALQPLPEGPANRLALARWIVDRRNPLTARVAVNRLWAQLFGTGLVETEEDFGLMGSPPSHPELLDWLAIELIESGWDMKALLRTMVTSAAYRQSSTPSPEAAQRDPRNRLLARGPRVRLEAEMVRDQALAIAGLLSRKPGGPSVYPPQPDGLWRAAFNGERTWATSTGEDRYRRGLYTYWRRTVPYPAMATFDAPSREICTLRRPSTNTPLQAFVTLNDPAFVEAAQALGRRVVREGGATVQERAAYGLKLALCRPPRVEETERIAALFESERQHYAANAAAAVEMATVPLGPVPSGAEPAELAAWTVVANVLLNLDGVLTKR